MTVRRQLAGELPAALSVVSAADHDREIEALRKELARAEDELEGWYLRGPGVDDEIRLLREFIEDVQLGVRDLSEYRDACRPVII